MQPLGARPQCPLAYAVTCYRYIWQRMLVPPPGECACSLRTISQRRRLTLEHVAEQFFHRSVADRAAEKQILDALRRNNSQQRQQQQQPTKPAAVGTAETEC